MRSLVFLFCVMVLFSCDTKKEQEANQEPTEVEAPKKEEKQFEMYEMSEMAALMEQMYVDNQRLKERIKSGDTIGQFPSHFMKIHSAVMTDKQENDAFFKEQAAKFIKAQEMIYKDAENAKEHFNNGVDACVKCHEVKCSGPIPRIKKLYIK